MSARSFRFLRFGSVLSLSSSVPIITVKDHISSESNEVGELGIVRFNSAITGGTDRFFNTMGNEMLGTEFLLFFFNQFCALAFFHYDTEVNDCPNGSLIFLSWMGVLNSLGIIFCLVHPLIFFSPLFLSHCFKAYINQVDFTKHYCNICFIMFHFIT